MNKIIRKSNPWLIRPLTTTNRLQTHRQYTQSSQIADTPPIEGPQRGTWRSIEGLVRCSANYVPLTPISFLERSADVYRDQTSVIYGSVKYTWEQTHTRCLKLASALTKLGISRGDVVATLAPNIPAMQELHFAVPMAGAILCTLNTRHNSTMIATLLTHSETKILFVDHQFLDIVLPAIDLLKTTHQKPPLLVIITEDGLNIPLSDLATTAYEYESVIEGGVDKFSVVRPNDEWDPISLNYTSGTTSSPKGVVYNHRGAYLNSIASIFMHGMGPMTTYLWSVPMFHCNGWCLAWGLAAIGGTNVCIRRCDPKDVFDNIAQHKVTHMSGAPTVLNMLVNFPDRKPLPHKVEIMTGGAPPPPLILSKMEELGFNVSHLYGLTETYGPGTLCAWKPEWDLLPVEERLKLKTRQGVRHLGLEGVDVKDPVTMESVEHNGKSIGEIMFKGNTVMNGYYKDRKSTKEAFSGGWFRSGDLAVKHLDGYIEVKDRSKDIIISGGENISTVEVETVIYSHPAVLEVAVVARPDNHWGQTPCAFVKLRDGFSLKSEDLIDYCRERMPRYMAPKTVVFDELPRTSTGKVQKFLLREKANALGSIS
ncbi:butanoate--CoA ligase AAE1-like [Rutidosis leptorrhynchoides]|uniref:butanoate--CoA ligase AAE1-like n=1 Tax=Rutidosis leptorrhynchoides TaxID=125765 RepID=UPI003A999D00